MKALIIDNGHARHLGQMNSITVVLLMLVALINNYFRPDRHYMPVTQCK